MKKSLWQRHVGALSAGNEGLEGVGVCGVVGITRDVDGALFEKQAFVALGFCIEVELGFDLDV